MFAAFIPGPDIISCTFVDTYQEACAIADQYFKETGIVVTVEEVAQVVLLISQSRCIVSHNRYRNRFVFMTVRRYPLSSV